MPPFVLVGPAAAGCLCVKEPAANGRAPAPATNTTVPPKTEPSLTDMQIRHLSPFLRFVGSAAAAWQSPSGRRRLAIAIGYGIVCHALFAAAVLSMMGAMFFGMSESFGRVPAPWDLAVNALLVLQFPLVHSVLLTRWGGRQLSKLAPQEHGRTLATTTYAIVASVQLLALFVFWTPSGIVWWRAEGPVFVLLVCLYACAWALLAKASFDAGAEVQSGALGWVSLVRNRKPVFPDMPTKGLFRIVRQPIYVAFALTLWTVPVWTPDQLFLALVLTTYCLLAPKLKERRFQQRYRERFATYRRAVPYAIPFYPVRRNDG